MLAGDLADLHTIGTRREGEGIGRALLAWCEQQARDGGAERMPLEVREDNTRARAVYAAAGYREIGRRRGYYRIRGRRIDALVMERDLAAPGGPSA
ncbi:GNAT family N-acetyltransferase [Brachybacterium sp. GPGPB12]|uniref:GNAT family N-acetyltransferase n=1 Tax=Brachybacterium sp. GPGPB12 TaxID=3023517 RepID=UPI003134240D